MFQAFLLMCFEPGHAQICSGADAPAQDSFNWRLPSGLGQAGGCDGS